ncbi:methylmalonyl-CoA mutase family protein [Thermocatellispora tengchongensis]
MESGAADAAWLEKLRGTAAARRVPVLGITGTGGSGKSSLTDELLRRIRIDYEDKLRVAVVAVDPTRRRGGGALLGDRIRMNSLSGGGIYFRSLATRGAQELPAHLDDVLAACRAAGYDLVIVETPGIGQGDAAIVPYADVSLYVMTPEFGAASQLEKIDMLDFADVVAINKFERRGAEDALRDVRRQLVRNREAFGVPPEEMPVFGTIASRFNDEGVTALYQHLRDLLGEHGLPAGPRLLPEVAGTVSRASAGIVPPSRTRYLAEIAEVVRDYHAHTDTQAEAVRRRRHLAAVREMMTAQGLDTTDVDRLLVQAEAAVDATTRALLEGWAATREAYEADELVVKVRDRELRTPLWRQTLSGNRIPRIALPRYTDHGDLLRFLRNENLPGHFPFTAGVFPFKRDDEEPTRMFAGEGDPFRTNRRFKLLSQGSPATRLSTAFDSVTAVRPRPGRASRHLRQGRHLGRVDRHPGGHEGPLRRFRPLGAEHLGVHDHQRPRPHHPGLLPQHRHRPGAGPLLRRARPRPLPEEAAELRARTLATVRGTVQADILKEDQGQNTCIFSTEFSLRMMADIQEWFIANGVRNFYSVSISGYHIAEAGANPISQLAFTLANGFTYVEAYLARGMKVDDFAPNLSFFFSNGMDPEYSVLGRVARRIWAVAMRERYGANERSQKLKYHIQTSGRSLHAQEMDFNDIRTTLQALIAIYDNCNSLHTNAYDEAVTTPSAESVRRAMAIQLIINREWGLARNENPLQGSFIIEELTDLVEEAVLAEFERISDRGGVLGAMETGYQRGKIQDESMLYEQRKHDGSLPIIGVNTFRNPSGEAGHGPLELARGTEEEKRSQLERLRAFHRAHAEEAPAALARLRRAAMSQENAFAALMDAARVCSLGQITNALFEIGGQYRRNV